MALIKRHHQDGCNGRNCECAWRLDYRPMGTHGPRRRLFFQTKKAAEKHLAETSAKASRGNISIAREFRSSRTPLNCGSGRRRTAARLTLPTCEQGWTSISCRASARSGWIESWSGASKSFATTCARTPTRRAQSTRSSESSGRFFARLSGAATLSAIRSIVLNAPSWRRASCARVKMKPAATTTRSARTRC